MAINIYSIGNHLKSEGWRLITDIYKNLDTELEMECPNGHRQIQTYRKWRKRPMCEICLAGDPFKGKKNIVPLKEEGARRILALDAATNVTGYAIYDDDKLVTYGTFKATATKETVERINEVKKWLEVIIEQDEIDYCGCEDIQLQRFNDNSSQFQVETYKALAQLRGVIADTLYELNIPHNFAYAAEWRKYCGVSEGIGRENKKKQAQNKVKLWYGQDCTQDEADAICIGKYFCHYIKNKKTSWGEDI